MPDNLLGWYVVLCEKISLALLYFTSVQTDCTNGPIGRLSVIWTFNKGKSMKKLFLVAVLSALVSACSVGVGAGGGSNGVGVGVGLGTGFGF